jgi:predicted  nucleic acid-binding Zn-ribbon protein
MKQLNENLSELFDVQPLNTLTTQKQEIVPVVEETTDVEADFNHARTNIKSLIRKGDDAIDKLLLVADASEHPRAYEVAANLIKTLADLNKDLLDIQKKRKELNSNSKDMDKNPINVDKAVFVGSTTELLKMIKNNKEE